MTKVIGIDPGIANTGWAIISSENLGKYTHIESGHIKTSPKDELTERIGKIIETVRPLMKGPKSYLKDWDKIKVIGIESVFFGKNVSSAMSTANVIGAISLAAFDNEIKCMMIRPNAVKEAVTGQSKGIDKGLVRHYVNKTLGTDYKNDHQVDACACGIAAIQALRARPSAWDQIMDRRLDQSKATDTVKRRRRSKPNHLRRPGTTK